MAVFRPGDLRPGDMVSLTSELDGMTLTSRPRHPDGPLTFVGSVAKGQLMLVVTQDAGMTLVVSDGCLGWLPSMWLGRRWKPQAT